MKNDKRFVYVSREPLYAVTMLGDPRYCGKLLWAAYLAAATQKLSEVANGIQLPTQSSASSDVNADQVTISASAAPPAKGMCIDQSPLDLLANELQASSTEVAAQECAAEEIARQNNIALNQCPLTWWRTHGGDYGRLPEVARRYQSTQCSR